MPCVFYLYPTILKSDEHAVSRSWYYNNHERGICPCKKYNICGFFLMDKIFQ